MMEKNGMSGIKLKYCFEIRDTKTGKLVRKTRKRICKSFVIGFMKHLEAVMAHPYGTSPSNVSLADTGGTTRSLYPFSSVANTFAVEAPGNDNNYGILVGTGTDTVTTSDHALQTKIAHGSGSGQLNHGSCVVGGAVDAGSGCTLTISRQFGNASGDTITIRELGLICRTYNGYYFLLSRDNVTQAVADGNTATAIIEISTEL